MTRTHEIEHLEEDAQRTRAKLTNTVDALRGRISEAVSPSVVTRDLQGYLLRKLKENPLQAAGLAAGLAFPLTRLLATMPAPILLVGAGIALSRTSVSETASGQLAEGVEGAKSALVDAASSVQDAAARATDTASAALGSISDSADSLRAGASDAMDAASDTLASAASEVSDTLQQYPLILGAIGLAIGALIGGAVPASRAEKEAFGELSDDLKRQAGTIATETLDAAKEAAGDVYAEAADEAGRQGLTLESAGAAADELKKSAGNIIHKAAGSSTKKKS
ncbi:MAG: hypothetical protein Q7T86_11895 [Hyphomicrobiaceae bacterium]|nr:hypothetical protein [Hyphomicrobiaceae bacterium]